MREIKFRGKRIDNGEWVYGFYVCYGGAIPTPTHIIHAPDNLNCLCGSNFEVDPKTVGGSFVYKGQRFFDGDILRRTSTNEVKMLNRDDGGATYTTQTHTEYVYVSWDEKEGCWYAKRRNHSIVSMLYQYLKVFEKDIENVGNVHDKPEFLEVLK